MYVLFTCTRDRFLLLSCDNAWDILYRYIRYMRFNPKTKFHRNRKLNLDNYTCETSACNEVRMITGYYED